jgi:serine/threonine protein phosphatase PrpC
MFARITSAGRSDIGRRRESNQDQFLIADLTRSMQIHGSSLNIEPRSRLYGTPQSRIFVVADGMGGHQAGSRASSMAIDFVVNHLLNQMHWYFLTDRDNQLEFVESMKGLIRDANSAIQLDSRQNVAFHGMGTTLTMAYVVWPQLHVVHVGDSRCYLFREGELKQITRDHTMASQLVDRGTLDRADIESSPWSNVLWNALGGGTRTVVADVYDNELKADDCLLLCSDGLNKHVKDDEIRNILEAETDPNIACRELIELANARGGSDNVTAIVARFDEPDPSPPRTLVSAQVTLERMIPGLIDLAPKAVADRMQKDAVHDVRDTDPHIDKRLY